MNNMTDANNNQGGSAEEQNQNAGSPATDPGSSKPTGESENNNGQAEQPTEITPEMYQELEKKLGQQGEELGGYREFVQNITPLLERLDENPDLVQAIVNGKIDKDLAQAVLDGKVQIGEAQEVQEAAKAVEKEVGKNNMQSLSPEEVEKMIEAKVSETRQEMEQQAEIKDFESRTQEFIDNTPDFTEYAEEIDKWLDNHNVSDIEVAYYAVKGQMSSKEAKKAADEAEAERNKELAMNASGGNSRSTTTPDGRPMIDDLVGGPANPLY